MRYLLLVAALSGCGGFEPAPVPEDTDWCGMAERNLEKMGCTDLEGDPMWINKNGERFEETCEVAQQDGRLFLNPRCVATATSCEKAEVCPAS